MVFKFKEKTPNLGNSVFMAKGTQVIGDVKIGDESSVWYNTVIRGDMAPITIGKKCNIQDSSVLHVNEGQPLTLEDEVTVGHSVILHGCTIKHASLIGMGSIVMNGSVIEEETMVAAGSLITENKTFPPRVLLMGSPAKVIRELTPAEIASLHETAQGYAQNAKEHQRNKEVR
ncbi:gamma carbonic anhydrase family protein [Desulfitobacterium metallireducens]|uniref:Acetyltransferase n=1 Tax=Desulfitobacterium metallireducens DSM 15288 TaxID=871968 RepID=W0EBB5_9FIRM|nr:gamma carbonic anhydrase family protein [Desulfitobacterium metallireducens]AHF06346.1 acetyltransferase [Desulfitobacterium metallireducens DSM 15288]